MCGGALSQAQSMHPRSVWRKPQISEHTCMPCGCLDQPQYVDLTICILSLVNTLKWLLQQKQSAEEEV